MKTKKEKIEAIYEEIAEKTLSLGCRVIIETTWLKHSWASWYDEEYVWVIYEYATWLKSYIWDIKEWNLLSSYECYLSSWECYDPDRLNFSDFKDFEWIMEVWESEENKNTTYLYKIIWHAVMIWDVLDFIKKNISWDSNTAEYILKLWEDFKAPIEDQSELCIDFICALLEVK